MAWRGQVPDEDPEAKKLNREAACAEYFGSLPPDAFTEEEEELRIALMSAIPDSGRVRLSIAAQKEEVRQAKQRLQMPQGAGLTQWITQRGSEQFDLATDPNAGEKILCVAGGAQDFTGPDILEDFYRSLPEHEFTEDEAVLREMVLLALKRVGGRSKLSHFTRGEQARELQQARSAVLPKGAPFVGWIERRLGTEVSIEAEPGGGHLAALLPAGKTAAAEILRGSGQKPSAGAPERPQPPRQPPKLAPGQKEPDPEEQAAAREQAKLDREVRVQEFFDRLPGDALTNEEQGLREALFSSIGKNLEYAVAGGQMRLSKVCQEDVVRQAKAALLPSEVTVATWIEARIGGEILLSKDSTNQVLCERAAGEEAAEEQVAALKPDKEDREVRMVEYFQGHPALSMLERSLRAILLEAVAKKAGEASRLTDVLNSDPAVQNAWKNAKATWLQQKPPLEVSFCRWVELRMADEVLVTRQPFVQLSRQELERRGLSRKRGAGEVAREPPQQQTAYHAPRQPQQPPAKVPRTSPGPAYLTKPGDTIRPLSNSRGAVVPAPFRQGMGAPIGSRLPARR